MKGTRLQSASRPAAHQRLRLVGALALIGAPLALQLPLWVSLLAAALLLWQAHAAYHDRKAAGSITRMVLALGAFVVVFIGFGRINGLEAGTTLLIFMLVLKLSEINSRRDAMVLLLLSYLLIVAQLLFSQALVMVPYLALGCWLVTALIMDINSGATIRPASRLLRSSGRLLLQALPLAAFLFVLFPRLPGPLWGLPADAGTSATTGLSTTMTPGSISNLATSDAVALRARFADGKPDTTALYWRGPVFWEYRAGTWSMGTLARHLPAPVIEARRNALTTVTIAQAPSRHDWLIALDVPVKAPSAARLTAAAYLQATQNRSGRRHYTVQSALRYRLQPQLAPSIRRYATRLPGRANSRARALAHKWRAEHTSAQVIVAQALALFREQPFVYTLTPARMGGADMIDNFLFATREGFCDDYAGAFTFLMRAAGVPARVVTGYLGGEAGTFGDYWLVRNANAHAWSEVWLAGRGWVRIDPTAVIAPERVEHGIAQALGDASALPYMVRSAGSLGHRLQMFWDGIDAGWNYWVLGYGPELQRQVLARLGLANWSRMLLALVALMFSFLLGISLWFAWRARTPARADGIERAWQRICRRLARQGFARAPHEGPLAYSMRVIEARPQWHDPLQQLAHWYIALRYAEQAEDAVTRRRFLRAAARFRPR